jgi:hypothetical protein
MRIKAISIARGESMISGSFGDVSPELEEIFLERVCEFEKAELGTRICRGRIGLLTDCRHANNWSANFAKIRCVCEIASKQATAY